MNDLNQEIEFRTFPMELRLTGDDDTPVLEGHIAVFDKLSADLGGFREKIEPGAFADSLKRDDIRALWNHQTDLVLGRVKSGTLELSEDKQGLAFKNQPPDTTWFRDRMVSLKRKDVTGASFGFITESDKWEGKGEKQIRTLLKLRLIEVSPGVTFPAYPQTKVAMRSMELWNQAEEVRNLEEIRPEPDCLIDLDLKIRRLRLHDMTS